jgi:nitroimidazol reductase NimA-like FMN-containing flavoprotein (pyridoxamine 5'-phosphate oxidase superfamily)
MERMDGAPGKNRLSRDECLALLGQVSLGRVAISIDALPAIRTVRFALAPDHVVFKVGATSRLRRAAANAVVAFHADHCDEACRRGWSVLVQGLGEEVTSPSTVDSLRALPLAPWSHESAGDTYMTISLTHVSGERATW